MKNLFLLTGALIALAGARTGAASSLDAVEITRLGERVVVVRLVAETSEHNNIVALKSAKGIVILDTHLSPFAASLIRERVLEEFQAEDVAYVINTHGHGDHTFGNQAFPEAVIIGHENVPTEMRQAEGRLPATVKYMKVSAGRLEGKLEGLERESEEAETLRKRVESYKATAGSLESGFKLSPPTKVFSDHTSLDLGDILLDLTYFGVSHSTSDILVYCPQEKLLLTGDLFAKGHNLWVDSDRIPGISRWRSCLGPYASGEKAIEYIVPGHGDFLDTALLAENLVFVEEREEEYAGKKSALFVFRDLHEREGIDAAVSALRDMAKNPESYYTLHPELDTYAYRLMLADKLVEAQKMMEALAELFPQKDVAFDSLGELYLRLNDMDRAARSFKKALELNPDNQNSKAKLESIEK